MDSITFFGIAEMSPDSSTAVYKETNEGKGRGGLEVVWMVEFKRCCCSPIGDFAKIQ